MLVKELIEELQKYNPEKEIGVICYMSKFYKEWDFDIQSIKEDEWQDVSIVLKEFNGYYDNEGN